MFVNESVDLLLDGLAAPLMALPAALLARAFMLGVKVGLEVVPPMATGTPLRRAEPAIFPTTPPATPPAAPPGIMPISWPAMPPAPDAAFPVLPPPSRPVSLRTTL